MKKENIDVFNSYVIALSKGDFKGVFDTMDDNIIWNMGGNGPYSGRIVGKKKLSEVLETLAINSNGTFKIVTNWGASNGNLVASSVVSKAIKDGVELYNPGIDLFRIENGLIKEVWTFSEKQTIEDEFWM